MTPEAENTGASPRHRVLIIDDEAVVCLSCLRILARAGHEVECHQNPLDGLEAALTGDYDVILLDLMMPEMDGMEVLRRIRGAGITSQVIIITGYSTVQTAVEAMKLGALDYIGKPFTPEELTVVLDKAVAHSALVRENNLLRRQLETRQEYEGLIGNSRAIERVCSLIQRVAPTQGAVLITGESGTGKEMVARAIHRSSLRKDKPFLVCDCSTALPALLESELFGHVKDAFSGAVVPQQGLFEAAHQGTLFLDEVSHLNLETQGKLLRVLESRRIRRVGDTAERAVDVRVISASTGDLADMTREGTFREDLYYHLNVVPIHVPPLRERAGDIALLAMAFLTRCQAANPLKATMFSPDALRLMEQYHWPGNIRELKNMVERVAILCDSERIEIQHLPDELRISLAPSTTTPLPRTWEELKYIKRMMRENSIMELERRFLLEALRRASGNVTKAAEDVGIQRTNLHALIRKYGLSSDEV